MTEKSKLTFITVKCLKYKDGCNWIGKLDDLQTHKCELCSCPKYVGRRREERVQALRVLLFISYIYLLCCVLCNIISFYSSSFFPYLMILCSCPHKTECESKAKQIRELIAEGENKEQQIRELGEKIKGLEAVVISQRLRNPPSRPPSPSGVPAFGRWSSSSALPIPGSPTAATRSSGNLLSLFNRNPVISAFTPATSPPPPSSSSPASTSVQNSPLSSSSYPSPSSAPCLSPLSSTSSSAVPSRRPNQTMAAPPDILLASHVFIYNIFYFVFFNSLYLFFLILVFNFYS